MKLDRNISANGRGKYALIKNRRLLEIIAGKGEPVNIGDVRTAINILERAGVIDWGDTPATEFFAIRLKDKFACPALHEYAHGARMAREFEYAEDVEKLARTSGFHHPLCKVPD